MRISLLFRVVLLSGLALCIAPLHARDVLLARPVQIVVPYVPGGISDAVARLLLPSLQDQLGQHFVVDNKPGAAGTLATEQVARAKPDGYSVLMGSAGPQTLAQFIQTVSYDGLKDFAPVSNVNTNPLVLVVNSRVPAQSVRELIALAKTQPGKLNYGSAGSGGLTHFAAEIFKHAAGVDITAVQYKGGAPSTTALLADEVQVAFASLSDVLPHMKSKRLRALGISSPGRSSQTPEVPTIAEAGLSGYAVESWNGLFMPAATPVEIVNKLSQAVQTALRDPVVRRRMTDIGCEPVGDTPAQFRAFVQRELERWSTFVKQTGIRSN